MQGDSPLVRRSGHILFTHLPGLASSSRRLAFMRAPEGPVAARLLVTYRELLGSIG
jgi:hypothetical protein